MIDDRASRSAKPRVPEAESVEPDGASLDGASLATRAIALWPRLDRAQLNRAHGDPQKIARVITRRTVLPVEAIVAILVRDASGDLDRDSPPEVDGSTDREAPLPG